MFMLDTDICSYIIRERPLSALERFRLTTKSQLCISVVTQAELLYGVFSSPVKRSKKLREEVVDNFLRHVTICAWDSPAAESYAHLRVELEKIGKPSGNFDMMIAAHALSVGATVVTNNARHFAHVPKLKTVNWV